MLEAARTVKKKVPGMIPLNVFTGKAAGEAAAMQGFEMLLYGTGQDPLYDEKSKKWVKGSKGFKDASTSSRPSTARSSARTSTTPSTPTSQTKVGTDLLPKGKLAIALDGSWLRNTGSRPAAARGPSGTRRWAWPRCRPRTARRRAR